MFEAGARAGLQPQIILDLTLWEFNATLSGYESHLLDLRAIAVEQGYYAAYYSNVKHSKSVDKIIKSMMRKKSDKTPDINVAAFKVLEQNFKEMGKVAR